MINLFVQALLEDELWPWLIIALPIWAFVYNRKLALSAVPDLSIREKYQSLRPSIASSVEQKICIK